MVLPPLVVALGLSTALAAPRGLNLVRRLLAAGAAPDGTELLAKARRSGGTVFVCSKDLKALGLKPADVLPGVVALRGYLPYDDSTVEDWERRLARAPDAKSLAVCAADQVR